MTLEHEFSEKTGQPAVKEKHEFSFQWQGISVNVTYCPDYSKAMREIQGYALAHIEVRAETRLPITETGYRSIWLPNGEVQEAGGAEKLVKFILDTEAQSSEWKSYLRDARQLSLF